MEIVIDQKSLTFFLINLYIFVVWCLFHHIGYLCMWSKNWKNDKFVKKDKRNIMLIRKIKMKRLQFNYCTIGLKKLLYNTIFLFPW